MLTKSIPHAFQATKRFRVTESDFEFEQLMTFTGAWVNKMKPRRFIKVGNKAFCFKLFNIFCFDGSEDKELQALW